MAEKEKRDWENVIAIPNSGKQFKYIELKNGLTALLISDSALETNGLAAAASMTVNVGCSLDPPEVPGLAHFLEHMVSLGSNRFPEEDELDNYLTMHGDDSNAETDMDHTQFHIRVRPENFEGALERFSELFIAPLFKRDSMDREINAIHSGNEISLRSENLDDLQARTKSFFDDHYHGASMKLCVIGEGSLSDLETWVRKYFGAVKKRPNNIPAINPPKPFWDATKSYVLESAKGVPSLVLAWRLPPLSGNCCWEKPEVYPLELLSNQGEGSLFAFLKNKGWVTDLEVFYYRNGRFTFSLSLTNSGFDKKYDLISYIYQYIKILRAEPLQEWVWKQYWDIKRIEFNCLDISGMATEPCAFANHLSGNMLKYPVRHVISADYEHNIWNTKAVEDMMQAFTPENMTVDFLVDSLKGADFKTEPWFGSHYIEEQIPLELIEEWSNVLITDPSLKFPSENNFIPTRIKPRVHKTTADLRCIVERPLIKMWHQCVKEGLSYAFLCINLNAWTYSVRDQVMMELFTELVTDNLSCVIFEGNQAKISSSFSMCEGKLVLQVEGYAEKLRSFLEKLWEKFKSFSPSSERFEIIKEQMARDLDNMDVKEQAEHLMLPWLYEGSYGVGKKLENLKQISFVHLKEFIRVLCSQIFIEGFCYGDMLETEAYEISDIFESRSGESGPPQAGNQKRIFRANLWNRPQLRRDADVRNKFDNNSMAKVYYQTGRQEDLQAIAKLTLFEYIVGQKLYNQLRTQEQLGYDVDCYTDSTGGVCGFYVYVVSSKYNASYLLERIYNFINDVGRMLEEIDEVSFKHYKDSACDTLFDGKDSIWNEIVSKRYYFNCHEEESYEVDMTSKEELIEWYKKYFRLSSPSCRKLAVCVWGCDTERIAKGT